MCLRTKSLNPSIADKDIVCYKLLKKEKFLLFFNRYYTPFQGVRVKLNQRFDACGTEEIYHTFIHHDIGYYDIGRGFVHAFRSIRAAESENLDRYIIVKAIIPKGVSYYEGINNDICAKSMYITKEKIKIQKYIKRIN